MTGGTWWRCSQPIGEQECVHLSRVAVCELTGETETAEALFFIIKLHQMTLYMMIITLLGVGGAAIFTASLFLLLWLIHAYIYIILIN